MKAPVSILLLDIGTETIKAVVLQEEKGKFSVSKSFLSYIDEFTVLNTRDFELDIIQKAIIKTVEMVAGEEGTKPLGVVASLPCTIIRGEILHQALIRDNPRRIIDKKEELEINKNIVEKAQSEVIQNFSRKSGILPEDIKLQTFKILEIRDDGYEISYLHGFTGTKMDFKVLATFLPKHYLERFNRIFKSLNIKFFDLVHTAQSLIKFVDRAKMSALLIDIGGEMTQIFFAKNGKLENITEFKMGSYVFVSAISKKLGITIDEARSLKERYIRGLLSKDVQVKIREIFSPYATQWFGALKEKIKEMGILIPPNILLFGGGSEFPEIADIITKGDWGDFPLISPPQTRTILPSDLKGIETFNAELNNPQYTPLFLMCNSYAIRQKGF